MRKVKPNKSGRQKSLFCSKRIINRIFEHNPLSGGVFSMITGAMGSGKTSVLLYFLMRNIKDNPNSKFFFSNAYNAPIQTLRIPPNKNTFMVQKGSGIRFCDRNNKLADVTKDMKIVYFTDYEDLYRKAEAGKCNTVFFGDRYKWMGFVRYLRSVGEWTSVFLDELSEIASANTRKKLYHAVATFASDLKETRKCMMDVHSTTQSISDIDYRVLSKVMIRIYLPGAYVEKNNRLAQRAVDNLDRSSTKGNEAYLLEGGEFGKIRFTDFYEPDIKHSIEARCKE